MKMTVMSDNKKEADVQDPNQKGTESPETMELAGAGRGGGEVAEGLPESTVTPDSSGEPPESAAQGEETANPASVADKPAQVPKPKPSPAANPVERRGAERHPVKWRAAIELNGSIIYGRTIDVSSSGAGILLTNNIQLHRSARLHMQLPPAYFGAQQEVISIDGWIAYATLSGQHGGFLVGIEFKKEAAEIAKLSRYFRRTNGDVSRVASGF